MIDEHSHRYLRRYRADEGSVGGGLLLNAGSNMLQTLGKKLLNSAAEKASQKAGEYLGEVATKGLIKQLLPIVKKREPVASTNNAFVEDLLTY